MREPAAEDGRQRYDQRRDGPDAGRQGGARLLGRVGHLDNPPLAGGDLRLRGGDVHRRPGTGRGARAGAGQGGGDGGVGDLHRGPPRGVRTRLRVSDVQGQRPLRGRVPARNVDSAAAHRQAAGRDRRRDRSRRDQPRCHRQGQRPGSVRAGCVCPTARHPDNRAMAGMGPRLPAEPPGLRREARHPRGDEAGSEVPVLHGRQPAAHLVRGRSAGGSLAGAGVGDVAVVGQPRDGARRGHLPGPDL